MKRKVIATVLGVVGLVGLASSSHGQGSVFFDNYDSTPYYPVLYGAGSGALTGTAAGANVNVELGYVLGSVQSGFTLLPSSITAINPVLSATTTYGTTGGYFQGPVVTIPGYVSGPVSFEILAWTGSTYANAAYTGVLTWTEPSIAASPSPAGDFTALPGAVFLTPVPEPTTLALAGLGGIASLVALRRKNV